ncbi:MAG: helix-turn-helix domain-containing protein [Candidatus Sumerlaeaceae bacterium]
MTELMTVSNVARVLALSTKRVYQLIASGKLDSLRTSPRTIRITRHSLEKYIEEQLERERRELGLDIQPSSRRRT